MAVRGGCACHDRVHEATPGDERGIMSTRVLVVLLTMAFAGHAAGGSIFKTGITEEDFQKLADKDAVIKPIVKTKFEARPEGTKVEVYYKRFGLLHLAHNPNARNADHFIMGKPGDPSWAYVKI